MNARKMIPLALIAAVGLAVPVLAAEDGKTLYDGKCAMCHGYDGVAKKMAAGSKNFNDATWRRTATADAVISAMKNGKGKMKQMNDKLTADQMKAIADYVLTLSK